MLVSSPPLHAARTTLARTTLHPTPLNPDVLARTDQSRLGRRQRQQSPDDDCVRAAALARAWVHTGSPPPALTGVPPQSHPNRIAPRAWRTCNTTPPPGPRTRRKTRSGCVSSDGAGFPLQLVPAYDHALDATRAQAPPLAPPMALTSDTPLWHLGRWVPSRRPGKQAHLGEGERFVNVVALHRSANYMEC